MSYKLKVIIESPYAGNLRRNIRYARACVAHSLRIGEAPIAFHLLYTQPDILDDNIAGERMMGMGAAQTWYENADLIAVYVDLGISPGMKKGVDYAMKLGLHIEQRNLPGAKDYV